MDRGSYMSEGRSWSDTSPCVETAGMSWWNSLVKMLVVSPLIVEFMGAKEAEKGTPPLLWPVMSAG